MRIVLKTILFLLACAPPWAAGQGAIPPRPDVLDDPEWQKRFLGSYGFLPALEPKVTQEELVVLRDLVELMKADSGAAAEQLEARINENSSPALIFVLGNLYFQDGKVEKAKTYYLEAVEKHPDFRRAHKNLGMLYLQDQNFAGAIKHLGRAVELGSYDGRTSGLLGYSFLAEKDYLAAEECYRDAIQQEPDVGDWKLGLARVLIETKRYAEAVSILDKLLEAAPTDADMWTLQANAYVGLSQPQDAAVNIEAVRALGKASTESLFLLGDIYLNMKMPEPALEAYQEAMGNEGSGVGFSKALRSARLLYQTGAYDESERFIETVQNNYSSSSTRDQRLELLTLKAKVARAKGESAEAASLLEKIVEEDGTRGDALIELANYYRDQDDIERAMLLLERAENLEEFEFDALVKRAQILAGQRKYSDAAGLLRRALLLKDDPRVNDYLQRIERAARG